MPKHVGVLKDRTLKYVCNWSIDSALEMNVKQKARNECLQNSKALRSNPHKNRQFAAFMPFSFIAFLHVFWFSFLIIVYTVVCFAHRTFCSVYSVFIVPTGTLRLP